MSTHERSGRRTQRCLSPAAAFFLILLGLTTGLRAQGVRYDNIVLGPRGLPVGAANVAVCTSSANTSPTPCTPLATIYADQALTQPVANPFQGDSLGNYGFWVPPGHYIVQIYGPGLVTKAMDVFLPCDPTNCSISSATFNTLTAGTLNLTGSLAVRGRNVATEALPSDAVSYVSPNGNDANDGRSWGSAFQTLYAALSSMETSSVQGGTLYVAANAACGGPVPGQGLWLYTTGSSPGTGWIQANHAITIVGVGNTAWAGNSHTSVVSLNCGSATQPALDLQNTNRPLEFDNLQFIGSEGAVLQGATTVVFRNDNFGVNSTVATNGPGVSIGSFSFWLYFYDCTFNGNSNAGKTPGADAAEAFVVNPSGSNSSGLIHVVHSIANSGSVKYYPGGTSASFFVDGLSAENQTDGHGSVWITNGCTACNFFVANVGTSDATGNTPAVEVDAGSADATVVADVGGQGINTQGPMTVVGASYPNNAQNNAALPLVQGNPSAYVGRSFWQTDAARRLFGPVASRFANSDTELPASWSKDSGVTVTTGVAAPDGTTNAGTVTNTNGFLAAAYPFNGNISLSAGDYLAYGVWAKGSFGTSLSVVCSGVTTTQIVPSIAGVPTNPQQSEEWEWYAGVLKIGGLGGATSCAVEHLLAVQNGQPADFFAPVLLHVPTGTITDSEAALLGLDLGSYPDSVNPPVESTLRGHPLAFGGSGDSLLATLDHTGLTANQTYTFPNQSGTVALTSQLLPTTPNIKFVQGAGTGSNGVSSLVQAFSSPVTIGDTIVVGVSFGASQTLSSLTDSQGDTFTQAATITINGGAGIDQIWYALNAKGGATTVTATFSASTSYPSLYVHEYSGVLALDQTGTATGNGTGTVSSSSVGASAGELVFGYGNCTTSGSNFTGGSGFTSRETASNCPRSEDLIQASNGTVAATFVLTGTSNWDALVATFKPNVAALTSDLPLPGTTAAIGGSSLGAGVCTAGTATVGGATTAMTVAASPAADPGTGFTWEAFVSTANTVTVRVCNITAGALTPTAEAYNVRVIQ